MHSRVLALVRNLFRRGRVERDLDREVEGFLDLLTEEKIRGGMSPEAARRSARIELGGRDAAKEGVRDVRAGAMVETVLRDLRFGLRCLRRSPGFTVLALLTLGLGIGGVTVIFSLVDAVLLRPLPYPDSERLMTVAEADSADPGDWWVVAAPNFFDWQARSRTFERMALYEYLNFNLSGEQEAEAVHGLRTTHDLFAVLGVPPMLGRTFTADDDLPGRRVVVLSEGLWRRRYGGDPAVVGRSIRINQTPYAVVGVMPHGFAFPSPREALWVPIDLSDGDRDRGAYSFYAIGRVRDGVTASEAAAEIHTIGEGLRAEYPDENGGEGAVAFPAKELWVGPTREMLGILFAAVGLVLLIACVNVANLLLSRGATRRHELAVRTAIGGSRRRVLAQLATESGLLAILGGAVALLVSLLVLPALVAAFPQAIRFVPFRNLDAVTLSPQAFLFAFGVAVVVGLVVGMVPALRSLPSGPAEVLQAESSKGSIGRRGRWSQGALVTAEVALAFVVLVGAGLLVASLSRAFRVDPGLDPEHVTTFRLPLPQASFYGAPERTTFCADVTRLAGTVPGVAHVGAISHLPLGGGNAGRGFTIEGYVPPDDDNPGASYGVSCPGYFAAMRIPILQGRDFSDADRLDAPRVAIVNDALRRTYFPDESPVGRRIRIGSPSAPWTTIVGVAADVRHSGVQYETEPYLYRPYSQTVWPAMTVVVRGRPDSPASAGPVRTALGGLAPDQPIGDPVAMSEIVTRSLGHLRFPMQLLTAFAGVAVVLAAAGIFGVASQAVVRRTRELGIRTAVGATPASLCRMVLGQSLRPVLLGLALGVGGALAATRLLQGLLFGVAATDPPTYLAGAVLLVAAALLASGIPAIRAVRLDPVESLRHE